MFNLEEELKSKGLSTSDEALTAIGTYVSAVVIFQKEMSDRYLSPYYPDPSEIIPITNKLLLEASEHATRECQKST